MTDLPGLYVQQEGGTVMPKTPAQARYDRLKKNRPHPDTEHRVEHDHPQKQKDGKTDSLTTVETNKPVDK